MYNNYGSKFLLNQIFGRSMLRRVGVFLISGMGIAFSLETLAQTQLERVVINGRRTFESMEFSQWLSDLGLKAEVAMMYASFDEIEMAGVIKRLVTDVRCVSGPGSSTVSTDEAEIRHGFAIQMYRMAVAAGSSQAIGSLFKVTWADDGTAHYIVASNGPGAQLQFIPARENPGDGKGGLNFEVQHRTTCKVLHKWEPTTRT